MQLTCGQCGKRHRIRPAEASWAECDACRHRIFIGHLTQGVDGPPAESDGLFQTDTEFIESLRKAIRERMLVLCGNCGGRMKVAKRMAGQKTRCPNCSMEVMIPVLEEEALFDDTYLPDDRAELTATAPEVQRALQQMHLHEHYVENPVDKKSLMTKSFIAAAAVLLIALIWLVFMLVHEQPDHEVANTPEPPASIARKTPEPTPTPTPTPKLAPGKVILDSVYSSNFVGGGYLPALPGKRYLSITVLLRAGEKPLNCANFGQDVTLTIRQRAYPALGEAIANASAALPLPARRGEISLASKASQRATFVFLAPSSGGGAELKVGSLPVMPLTLSNAYEPVGQWVQSYAQIAPRSLKPLLVHPVMAAIQNTPRPTLVIRKQGAGLLVAIPEAGVQGLAASPKGNLCRVTLKKDKDALSVKLYWVDVGEKLVLSLADEPMHQLVFAPASARPSPHRPAPQPNRPNPPSKPAAPGGKPDFFGL